jgi:hypothetical protein
MRLAIAVIVGLLLPSSRMTVSAAQPGYSVPAAELVYPINAAATLDTPVASTNQPVAPQPTRIVRGATPSSDPLVGEYSPAAQLDPKSSSSSPAAQLGNPGDIRVSGQRSSTDLIDTPEQHYEYVDPVNPSPTKKDTHDSGKFGDQVAGWWDNLGKRNNGAKWFESDHCFDSFISPLTSPFYAEDPRSLTELRPLFIYQTIPNNQVYFRGGNITEFVLQGRLAITDWFSLVVHRLGVMNLNRGSGAPIEGGTSITELALGPKFTFYRNDQSKTLAAAGMQFQIPIGAGKDFQNTGTLSLVPYGSFAQKFWQTSFGEMAFMTTLAYSASINNERSDFFYTNLHLDYDIGNLGRFYPTLELNWYHYTTNGTANNIGVEGQDLMNIGAAVAGRNFVAIAPGFRFKFSERWQTGIYAEFPLIGTRDIHQFRLGLDLIWRY